MALEVDVRYRIDKILNNKGWKPDPDDPLRNVFFESSMPGEFAHKLGKKRPDYTLLYRENTNQSFIPIGVIEAKKPGQELEKALDQATIYAEKLNAPLIFAINGTFCKTRHITNAKSLFLNGQEVKELLRVKEALGFLSRNTNELYTIPKEVIRSREDMISLFGDLNNVLRSEGLRAGIERFSEFANVLFLKLLSEHQQSAIWNDIKKQRSEDRINYINKIVLDRIVLKYGGDVFSPLLIKKPSTLDDIIERLDPLYLTPIDEDIKGGAFEYFLEKTTSTQNDLGEYFTPRHIIKAMVNLVDPHFGETVYDPFCGTGGFLTGSFNHIRDSINLSNETLEFLRSWSIFGREITTTSRIAKMNMILHGDGHSGVEQIDSLENPIEGKYDIVLTNIPFSQKIVKRGTKGKLINDITNKYYNGLGKNSGDAVCFLHCLKSLKRGGRMAVVVPEGFLFRKELAPVRHFITEISNLHSVISLPQGCFLPYTGVKTDVLFLTDAWISTTSNYWYFKVENDGYSLDNNRRKLDSDNDIDKVNSSQLKNKIIPDEEIKILKKIGFLSVSKNQIIENNYNYIPQIIFEKFSAHELLKLKDITHIVNGGTPGTKTKEYWNGNINWATIKDINGKFLLETEKHITKEGLDSSSAKILPEYSVIFSSRATIGVVCINKVETCTNQGFKNFICDTSKILPEYLYYILKHEAKNIEKLASGTTFKEVSKDKIGNFEIPVPSLQKQQEIIEELNSYQHMIDGANAVIDSYKPFFEVEKSWPIIKLENIIKFVRRGKTPTYGTGTIGIIKSGQLKGFYDFNLQKQYFLKEGADVGDRILKNGDILINTTGVGTAGRVGVFCLDGCYTVDSHITIIRVSDSIVSDYVMFFLAVHYGFKTLENMARGSSGQIELSIQDIKKLKISLPDYSIQKHIVTKLKTERTLIENQKIIISYFSDKMNERLESLWSN